MEIEKCVSVSNAIVFEDQFHLYHLKWSQLIWVHIWYASIWYSISREKEQKMCSTKKIREIIVVNIEYA